MLQEAVEPLAYELAFWMQGLDNPEMEIAEVAKLSAELASGFRAMAIIAMATAGSIDGFCHNLIRSALVRSRYLQRVHDSRAFDSHHFASGRYKPLADAIAAGEYTLAAKLHQLSPTAWQGRREYRDDFCFGRLLGNLLLPEEGDTVVSELLEEFETYLDGNSDARLDVCRALVKADATEFNMSFLALIQQFEEQVAEAIERGEMETPIVVAQRKVFIDGLALLRLADRRGMATEKEYRYCPSLARRQMQSPFPGQ